MQTRPVLRTAHVAASGLLLCLGFAAAPVSAAPVVTTVNADLTGYTAANPYSFSFMGGTFNVTGTGSFPDYIAVSTSGAAAVRTVFGSPSTDFFDRGTVIYDSNTLGGYGSFPDLTTIGASNGDNLLGLRVTSGGQQYYGFLYTTNTTLNSYGFETTPGVGINPPEAIANAAAAVPEPASWALMIGGFGLVGATMRRRKVAVSFA